MIRPNVARRPLMAIILVSRKRFGEVGERTPLKLAGLIDAGLLQCLLDQTTCLVGLMIIMAGKDDGGDTSPGIRAVGSSC